MKRLRFLVAATALSLVPLAGCAHKPKAADPAAAAPATDAPQPAESTEDSGAGSAQPVVDQARQMLAGHLPDVKAAKDDGFTPYKTRTTGDTTHVRFTRTYNGLPVRGGDVVVHTDGSGAYRGVSNGLDEPLRLSTKPTVSATAAGTSAKGAFRGAVGQVGKPRLVVDGASRPARLAWETVVVGTGQDRIPSRLHVMTDAKTGQAYRSWDEVHTVVGNGRSLHIGPVSIDTTRGGTGYKLVDPSHGNGSTCDLKNKEKGSEDCTTFTDTDNVWGDGTITDRASAAVEAHYGAAKTFDYFKTVHGRNGIFNDGKGVVSRVHWGDQQENAFWDGIQMTYGDGVGNAKPFISLDVAGHEMAHGVTQESVPGGLSDSGESACLNEATCYIFGTAVEFYANNPNDPPDYVMGEEVDLYGNGKPFRFMYDPSLEAPGNGCWSANTKTMEEHAAAGVADHFYFALAEGTGATKYGTSPVCGTAPAVKGIGRAKAEKIWYRALDVYFTSTTSYVNTANPTNTARAYSLRAAQDLYGRCSTEYKTVRAAWTAVNVAGPDAACP
jgi:Zn-dependent metalloprotease